MQRVLPHRVSKALWMWVLPLPLVAEALGSLLKGEFLETLVASGALVAFYVAASLMRKGLLQEAVLGARRYILKRPPPLKTMATLIAGVTTAAVSFFLVDDHVLWKSIVYGVVAMVGARMLYGPDPAPRFSDAAMDEAKRQEVMAALGKAEERVLAIEHASENIFNEELSKRLGGVVSDAREILDLLADRPDQMRQARRFLNTYLDGAEQVANGYASTHTRAASDQLEEKFSSVLTTIEGAFAEQKKRLVDDDVQNLDVKIEVLTTQIEREGL
ncbi:MAG: 5-bromo-4-chloroindolyl phosphate hydrolysis family protein [Pseudomonadota bacterium]